MDKGKGLKDNLAALFRKNAVELIENNKPLYSDPEYLKETLEGINDGGSIVSHFKNHSDEVVLFILDEIRKMSPTYLSVYERPFSPPGCITLPITPIMLADTL